MDIWGEASQVPPLGRRISLALAYSAFILVNVASSLGWLGATNAEVSAKFQTALTPAGCAQLCRGRPLPLWARARPPSLPPPPPPRCPHRLRSPLRT